jgi:aspartate/methionine/tyrosine aminotransferase
MKLAKNLSRLGTESAFKILAEAKKLEKEGKDIIHLSVGQPDFKTPKYIVNATKKALDDGHHGYVLSNGTIECREAVSRKIKTLYNKDISPERVIIMPGGKPTMYYAITLFGEPGAEIIYPDPGFPIYESMINYTGAKAVPINILENNDFSLDPKKILSLINDKTRLIILNNPNNPTGGFTDKSKIDQLAEGLKKFPHVAILSDEIYSRQIFDQKKMPTFFDYSELYNRLIILDGWSKAYSMTGWRLGWGVWPENLVEHVNKFCVNNHSCVNAAVQFGGIAALDGPDDFIIMMMEKFEKRRKIIFDGLNSINGIECSLPGGGFYAFPKVIGTGMNGQEFAKKCLHEAGVAIVPGTAFGKKAVDYVRFSFAASQDNISKALEKIRKMLG